MFCFVLFCVFCLVECTGFEIIEKGEGLSWFGGFFVSGDLTWVWRFEAFSFCGY